MDVKPDIFSSLSFRLLLFPPSNFWPPEPKPSFITPLLLALSLSPPRPDRIRCAFCVEKSTFIDNSPNVFLLRSPRERRGSSLPRACSGGRGDKDDSFMGQQGRARERERESSSHITQGLWTKSIMSQLTGMIMSEITATHGETRARFPIQPGPDSHHNTQYCKRRPLIGRNYATKNR